MKKFLLLGVFALGTYSASAQCTTTNATSCQCQNQSQTNCSLLPDITISWQAVNNGGYTEYSQTSTDMTYNQGPNAGRLRVTGSTPNIGHGPLTARGVDSLGQRWFICGTDTFSINDPNSSQTFVCPNGDPNPHQIIFQRVYQKSGNTMTYYERPAGTMTYHPTHGHNHVDQWDVHTLRIDNGDPNPLNWPIVGTGQKMGFCLMDYGQCGANGYIGHCRDDNTVFNQGTTLINADFPNWGLGGGQYNCSQIEQGISSGWTDVYGKHLDGMWINIPPGTCNGQYYIVFEVDPNNHFLEENDGNNYTAVPVTLTLQEAPGNGIYQISADRNPVICPNENITLTATAGTAFLWSTGDTTQTIIVNQPGTYTCDVTNYCGVGTATYTVYATSTTAPTSADDTVCNGYSITLNANGAGTLRWRDNLGNVVGTGTTYTTPNLSASTFYTVESVTTQTDSTFATPHNKNMGSGNFTTSAQYEIFNVYSACTLLDVRVYANTAGNRTIQLQDSAGNVLQTATVAIVAGDQRVPLNFNIAPGNNYRLAGTGTTDMFRNDGGVSYPYDVAGVLRITNSSAGLARYYFFYDWHLATTNEACVSSQTNVNVFVDPCLGLGENTLFSNSIQVAPNPSNGLFTVNFDAPVRNDVTVQVTDLVGRIVYTDVMQNVQGRNTRDINMQSLSKGVYLFSLVYEGKAYTQKIIIE
ncbi:MAG: T9SS type A sorting domain-containing protein [Bacteroidia bacterium]